MVVSWQGPGFSCCFVVILVVVVVVFVVVVVVVVVVVGITAALTPDLSPINLSLSRTIDIHSYLRVGYI